MFINVLGILGVSDALANAPAAGASTQGGGLLSLLPMLAILILFMYFMVFRPQSKRAKEHRNLISSLKEGDEITTIGGILASIKKITDTHVILTVTDGTDITVQKNAIANCLPKGTLQSVK